MKGGVKYTVLIRVPQFNTEHAVVPNSPQTLLDVPRFNDCCHRNITYFF